MKTQKFKSYRFDNTFKPCHLAYFSSESPDQKSGAESADKEVDTKAETLTNKQDELKNNLQKAEERVAELKRKMDEHSGDKGFQDLLASRNIDAGKQLEDAALKIGEAKEKAGLEKTESEKNNAKILEAIQKVL